jgi:DNA replication licensing factor MCM7
MAQAIARIHFRNLVSIQDVDEALRLIKSAKSSLNDSTPSLNRDLSKTTHIYEIIRQMHQAAPGDLLVEDIQRRVIGRGFTEEDMWNTIREYSEYGVLFTLGGGRKVKFVVEEDLSDMEID